MHSKFSSRVAANFTGIYLAFLALAVFLQQFLPSYLNYASIQSVSWKLNDGWCEPQSQGIGVHCFGDFYYPLTFANQINPWQGFNPYPPLSVLLFRPFSWIDQMPFSRLALILFIATLVIALIFPVFHLKFVAKEISYQTFSILLLVTLLCAPAIVTIDRGNNLLMLIPFLYLFFRNWLIENNNKMFFYGLICVGLRPQFIILGVVIFQSLGLRKTIKWLSSIAALYLASFVLYPQSFPMNVAYWVYKLFTFPDYAARGVLMPVNISLSSDLDIVLIALGINLSTSFIKAFIGITAALFIYFLAMGIRRRSKIHNLILLLFLPLLFTGTAFHYYLILLYIPFLFHFARLLDKQAKGSLLRLHEEEVQRPILSRSLPSFSFLLFSIFAFIPWGIPWNVIFPSLKNLDWSGIGINWIVAQYSLVFFALVMIWPSNTDLLRRSRKEVRN
jgi:hypothetical protein